MAQDSESIQFDTKKTVREIANVLRSYRGNKEKLKDDPLAGAGGDARGKYRCDLGRSPMIQGNAEAPCLQRRFMGSAGICI